MSAAEHPRAAIAEGCTRGDEHDHVGDHRAEVLAKAIGRLRAVPVQCTALTGPVWYGQGWADAITTLEDIAEYSVPDYEAYPGELVRLRALALQLRALARQGSWDRVMGTLHDHSAFESTARASVEKDSAPAPTSTPQPEATPLVIRWDRTVIHPEADPTDDTIVCCLTEDGHPVALLLDDEHREALGLTLVDPDPDGEATDAPPALDLVDRQQHLLAAICRKPRARWATGRVEALYRDWGVQSPRSTGRSDLQDLHRLGHLTPHGPEDGRYYLLNDTKGGTR